MTLYLQIKNSSWIELCKKRKKQKMLLPQLKQVSVSSSYDLVALSRRFNTENIKIAESKHATTSTDQNIHNGRSSQNETTRATP